LVILLCILLSRRDASEDQGRKSPDQKVKVRVKEEGEKREAKLKTIGLSPKVASSVPV